VKDDARDEPAPEAIAEEAKAGGVAGAGAGGRLHLEADDRPVGPFEQHVDLDPGPVPEVGERQRLVDHRSSTKIAGSSPISVSTNRAARRSTCAAIRTATLTTVAPAPGSTSEIVLPLPAIPSTND